MTTAFKTNIFYIFYYICTYVIYIFNIYLLYNMYYISIYCASINVCKIVFFKIIYRYSIRCTKIIKITQLPLLIYKIPVRS